ncbi:hypothetical protein J7382_03435 [Shimia sp. R11_0]|uniref:hypothetical protein n=1 Tax=Shimia sp. R11_0 TaxID=2821096 RepID=UPI001ADC665E|nr:hypothetical protein [Shimia sp. R11_0]MBO9476580.1 hypothetical protein [Shimia sp. R11_0]
MRCVTITYEYEGDDMVWVANCEAFINAVGNDPGAAGFSYQVAVADDGITRVHWGRWNSDAVLRHVQAQEYFKTFDAKLRQMANGSLTTITGEMRDHTDDWHARAPDAAYPDPSLPE